MDTICVELKSSDGSMITIDTIAAENEVADNMYQRPELDYLIYNNPIAYADLLLGGHPEAHLKTAAEYNNLIDFHALQVSLGTCFQKCYILVR